MKKTITLLTLLAGAVSGYSQGQISFNNTATGYKNAIFANAGGYNTTVTYSGYNSTSYTVPEEVGNTSADKTAGSQVYAGAGLVGTGFSYEILGAAGSGDALSTLAPVGSVGSFQTAVAGAGFVGGTQVIAIPGTSSGSPAATIAIAAWNNEGGTVTTLLEAMEGGKPWGISPTDNINTTFPTASPAAMSTGSDLVMSFSLGQSVPEPSTIALGVMGVSTLLFRRKK